MRRRRRRDADEARTSLVALDLRRRSIRSRRRRARYGGGVGEEHHARIYLPGRQRYRRGRMRVVASRAGRFAPLGKVESTTSWTEPGSSLKSVSLVGRAHAGRGFGGAGARRAPVPRRGRGQEAEEGEEGRRQGEEGRCEEGGKKGEKAVPVLQSELAQAAPGTFRAFETTRPEEGTSSTSSIRRREASLALSLRRTTDT